MGTPHKHRDVIIAWANGEEIEIKNQGEWVTWERPDAPAFNELHEWRIKPKRVKKEGWVNIYKATEHWHVGMACTSNVYPTKEEALAERRYDITPTDTIRITWEEEE